MPTRCGKHHAADFVELSQFEVHPESVRRLPERYCERGSVRSGFPGQRSRSLRCACAAAGVAIAWLAACGQRPAKPVVLAGRLLLETGAIDGEVLIGSDGKIACAAASCSASPGYGEAVKLELGGAVISPGLINAHDHSNFNTVGPQATGAVRYQHRHGWRVGAGGATPLPAVPRTTDRATIAAAELRHVLGGATSLIASDGAPGLARNLASSAASEGLTGKAVKFDTFPLGDSAGELRESGCDYPKIVTPSQAFADGAYAPHIAEGIDAAAQNELGCLDAVITDRTAIIDGVAVDARGADAIRRAGAKLIWSPRSNLSLYGDTSPVTLYRALGVPIALGTDWLASGSMNLLRELACAQHFNQTALGGQLDEVALWRMVTGDAALAAGFAGELGRLEAGLQGDITVFAGTGDHRALLSAGVEDIKLVLRGGHPLYGEAALVSALEEGCTPLDVCGRASAVCLEGTGVSLEAVRSAAAGVYPLFSCRDTAPEAEPTCVPFRDGYPGGITATDRDGDGIEDLLDDCPGIFNPVRPMDQGRQADADGDGAGDVCDAAPLDPARR